MALLEFYGEECSHCNKMRPVVEQLEKDLGVEVKRFETWHNDENQNKFREYDDGCGGVPYYFNTETKKSICGEASIEDLKKWAKGE